MLIHFYDNIRYSMVHVFHSFQKIVSKDKDLIFTSTLPISDTELTDILE